MSIPEDWYRLSVMADNKALIDLSSEGIVFYHVALLHGFRAAAAHLGLSKSVVSSKVSSLETRIGRKLLYRSTRDVSLTPEGEVYFESCRTLFAATQNLQLSESKFKSELSGTFTISAPHDFMTICLIPALQKLHSLHPKLRLNFVAADNVLNLEKNKIDLAIRVGAEGAGHLYRTNFFNVDFGFYCKASLAPPKKSEKEILEWIQEEGIFAFRPSREKSFTFNGKSQDVKVQSKIQVHDVLSLKSLIMAGAGIGILPHFAIASEMATGELVQLLPGAEFKQVSYIFLSGVRRQEDSRLNAIIEFLQQAVPTFQI
ncbi:MAG: LysR family transcriptional regulator [Bdellovibrionales bacterium]|nr:LysR family transcriptional regulator [Bdellovibrionales bacterium]